ncbi:MAG: hypothetical protein IJC43_04485, partial [Clostridia bacterium]|nr:hypothetical protein [Clostridia bacterium]
LAAWPPAGLAAPPPAGLAAAAAKSPSHRVGQPLNSKSTRQPLSPLLSRKSQPFSRRHTILDYNRNLYDVASFQRRIGGAKTTHVPWNGRGSRHPDGYHHHRRKIDSICKLNSQYQIRLKNSGHTKPIVRPLFHFQKNQRYPTVISPGIGRQ